MNIHRVVWAICLITLASYGTPINAQTRGDNFEVSRSDAVPLLENGFHCAIGDRHLPCEARGRLGPAGVSRAQGGNFMIGKPGARMVFARRAVPSVHGVLHVLSGGTPFKICRDVVGLNLVNVVDLSRVVRPGANECLRDESVNKVAFDPNTIPELNPKIAALGECGLQDSTVSSVLNVSTLRYTIATLPVANGKPLEYGNVFVVANHYRPTLPGPAPVVRIASNVPQIPWPVPQLSDRSQATIYAASSVFLWGSTAWDAVETDRLVATGRYIEGNPILRREDGSLNKPLKFSISAVGQIASYYDFKHGHPWRAVIINVVFAAPQFIAAWVSSTRH